MAIFIFDIDGTLCEDSSVLEEENIKVLENLKSKGHRLIFATGRGLEAVRDAFHHNENLLNTLMACENGSKLFSNGKIISVSKFSKQEVKLILDLIFVNNDKVECIDFWINSKLYTFKTPSFATPSIEDRYRVMMSFAESMDLIQQQEPTMLNVNFNLRPSPISCNLNILVGSHSMQILPLGVSKARLYDHIDLSSEMYLFGDSNNDLELFKQGKEINKSIYLVGKNLDLKPYAAHNIKGIGEVFRYLQSNF